MRSKEQESDEEHPLHSPRDKAVRVSRTPVGWGVFAQRRYQAEEIIGEIEGTVMHDVEYTSSYCMDMGDHRSLEPAAPFRFVNHSCDPNCRFAWFDIETESTPRRRVFLLACEMIRPGDQLTIDYNWPPAMAIPCRCHAENCRGWIVAEDQLADLRAMQLAARQLDETCDPIDATAIAMKSA